VSIVAGCVLLPALPFTQREQWLRHAVESNFRDGRVAAALQSMSEHTREEFPPHWDPPPRIAYATPLPDLKTVLEQVTATSVAPWVLDVYAEKYANWLYGDRYYYWREMNASELERQLAIIEKLPNRKSILGDNKYELLGKLKDSAEPLRGRLERMLTEAGIPLDSKQKDESQASPSGLTETPANDAAGTQN
jgi:hypothetical protein